MKRRNEQDRVVAGIDAPGHESIRTLLRKPGVQALLVVAAAAQVVAVQQTVEARGAEVAMAPVAVEAPAAEPGVSAVADAWAAEALKRKSDRIAAQYRADGYPVSERLAELIHSAAVENGIEPEVAFGLIRAESSFRTTATSPVGAVGLTQLMPNTAKWLSPETSRAQLRDPETNVRIGFGYLRQLIDKYEGDVDLALVAYNRGPGTVDRALRRGLNPDNGYSAFVKGEENHGHTLYTR